MSPNHTSNFLYFDKEHAIEVHDWIIEHSGGMTGLKDDGGLESPLEHVKNEFYYPNFEDKLTYLVYAINKNHAFNDGNKRASLVLGAYFLEINGFGYLVKSFIKEMENIVVDVAANRISKELLHKIISAILYDDFNEALKLQIIAAKADLLT